ncbi:MAG: TonB-dependent receptor, partial [Polyangiaceae bacterium]|nr:TonB-dependent receptor [Polyangiaceae bacterium]
VEFTNPDVAPLVFQKVAIGQGETTQILATVDGSGALKYEDIEAPDIGLEQEPTPEKEDKEELRPGKIVGQVIDSETQRPVAGAQVYVRGKEAALTTDSEGRFEVEVLQGDHAISVLQSGYASQTEENIIVEPEQPTEVKLSLNPSSAELEDFVVTAPYVQGGVSSGIAEEQQSSAVQDVIGAEQMSKSGDSDASSALGRVTGLTVVGGKFVYVRGMGERYSSTLLNGAQVPSPEPERRVVPLNLFPTTVLESVVVQKTYSPDMPADFGGGVVQLRTRSYPEEFLFKVGGSLNAITGTSFTQGPSYQGSPTDWLGFDNGSRNRSSELAAVSKRGEPVTIGNRFEPGVTAEEMAALGRSLPNSWNTSQKTLPPGGKLNITVGDSLQLGKMPFGYVAAAQYSNDTQRRTETRRTVGVSGDDLTVNSSYDIDRVNNNVGITGMLGLGLEFLPNQNIFSNTMILRNSDNLSLEAEGFGQETPERLSRLRFVERQLFTQQLRGEHVFEALNNFQANWRFVYSNASRSEPDRRDYRYDQIDNLPGEPYLVSVRGGAIQRFYSDLDDKIFEGGLDLTYPIAWTEDIITKIKGGAMLLDRSREVTTYRYQYYVDSFLPLDQRNDLRAQDLETIMAPENIRTDGVTFGETTGEDEPYNASQKLRAGYGMVETPLGVESLNLMAGLRYESSLQNVNSINENADLNKGDWLPAATLTWAFIEDMQVRGGYSKTVSRPDFRELALARFFDVESSTEIIGNPNLKRATIQNFDVRWEWYLSSQETLSIAGFYKAFDSPIETVILAGSSTKQSWQNADSATNAGLEFEARKNLGFTKALENFYIATNLSLIKSSVKLPPPGEAGAAVNTSSDRPLEGQSPYVVNVQFGYDADLGDDGNLSTTILYNQAGRRIVGVGSNQAPDQYEESVPRLDFVLRHKIDDHFTWGFKAQNLLNPKREVTQGDVLIRSFRTGLKFTLGATYTY